MSEESFNCDICNEEVYEHNYDDNDDDYIHINEWLCTKALCSKCNKVGCPCCMRTCYECGNQGEEDTYSVYKDCIMNIMDGMYVLNIIMFHVENVEVTKIMIVMDINLNLNLNLN